ncbi:MAG: TIGR03668 family PPOX class F420-dependent oxidoreductase [SAR202 cluster bacterium]|nr:TIGR03668 family PPOX class F420-dependent oxidoreductase [SAR202 cluster bacterium]
MGVNVTPRQRDFIARHRVARLATADAEGRPHVIPVCYVLDGDVIYSAIDRKPKRVGAKALKRVRNIAENPRVALVIDDYAEDWSALAYVLVFGAAILVESGSERQSAERMLREKYPQYETMLAQASPVLKISIEKVTGWGAV